MADQEYGILKGTNPGGKGGKRKEDTNINVKSSLVSLKDSREGLFISSLNNGLGTPVPPSFKFQPRGGRLNWRAIMQADVHRIAKDVDLRLLEDLLQNITFAQMDREDLDRFGDDNFIKLFRLCQLSIEYLIYS